MKFAFIMFVHHLVMEQHRIITIPYSISHPPSRSHNPNNHFLNLCSLKFTRSLNKIFSIYFDVDKINVYCTHSIYSHRITCMLCMYRQPKFVGKCTIMNISLRFSLFLFQLFLKSHSFTCHVMC